MVTSLLILLAVLGYAGVKFQYKPLSGKAVLTPITISGIVVSSSQPTSGLADVYLTLISTYTYDAITNAEGQFIVPGVESGDTYMYAFTKAGYQTEIGTLTVANSDIDMGTIALTEIISAPQEVVATQNLEQNQVSIVWLPPSPAALYQVWRFPISEEENEANWTMLTPVAIADTTFSDTGWNSLPSGIYKYAVKAIYSNNVLSAAAFSNEVRKGMMGILNGTVREAGSNIPLNGATISAGTYLGYSNSLGNYSFLVYQGTYNVSCTKTGYQPYIQPGVEIVGTETTGLNFYLLPNNISPTSVVAQEIYPNVRVSWTAPGMGESQWLHYDNGLNNDSVGTGIVYEYDVAIRFPAASMQDFAGMSLYAIKMWPAMASAGNFSLRVWRGGNSSAPATLVTDQAIAPVLGSYNTFLLNSPVSITGNQELWFGYHYNGGGYPAGCDAGPAIDGYGNMIHYDGAWSTLLDLSPGLNSNWNIQGYVGFAAPAVAPVISPISLKTALEQQYPSRTLGYKLWRLHPGEENNESVWISLTPSFITTTYYTDTAWMTLPYDAYKWAVKSIYSGESISPPSFSNTLAFIPQIGTISGLVRNYANQLVSGATVVCGNASTISNAVGAYSLEVASGTHSVTASHPYYTSITTNSVYVMAGLITTVNFALSPWSGDNFEGYPDFALSFAPWTFFDVDLSPTIGLGSSTWQNLNSPMAFMIFNPNATIPPLTNLTAHGGSRMACSFAATVPPTRDWMVAPAVAWLGGVRFWARSISDSNSLAMFKLGISSSANHPPSFIIISGDNPVEVPPEWTEYTYYITYTEAPVYIGLASYTLDDAVLCIDDFKALTVTSTQPQELPRPTMLLSNYPNPFNPETTISYSLKEASPVKIDIYNTKGQLVKNLENGTKAAGDYKIVWDGKDYAGNAVSSGVFYYKMSAGKYSSTRKMIMLK
jgi:hypothetical protein